MAKTKTPNKAGSVIDFLRQVRQEMQQVTWPSREETVRKTLIVVAVTVITGFYLGGLDYLFARLLGLII